jgi:transposase
LSEVRAHLGRYYSDVGRPSIDPELMIRMLIVGYYFGIPSERRLRKLFETVVARCMKRRGRRGRSLRARRQYNRGGRASTAKRR